jgi:CubicO group peptidase (beta-lactamase class C family)
MHFAHKSIFILLLLVIMNASHAAGIDKKYEQQIDRAVAAGIELEMTPGAVIAAGRADGVAFLKAYGHMTYDDNSPSMTNETVFDLASLSKTIGCATSIMILAERGKLDVKDPVSKYLTGMKVEDKKDITIEQCLLHCAGFVGDNPIKDFKDGPEAALKKIYAAKLKYEPGKSYIYSDNSMIVLGEVVKAVSGQPLNAFATENIFKPLKMAHTAYLPPTDWRDHIAPTEKRAKDSKEWIVGEVHDPRALALGGFAGHAGVFADAGDVARFCRMMLNKGELDGVRILSEKTVATMTRPHQLTTPDGEKAFRAYGFDVDSAYSGGPRGKRFAKGKSYGHTGYTGTSYWIDPASDAFVVILTNRVHPDDDAEIKMLRKRVATVVGDALIGTKKSAAAE